MQHPPVVIPSIRSVVRHALPNVIEGKLVPLVLFIAFLELIGTAWALVVALVWSVGAIAIRTVTGRRIPGLVVLSATTLAARTVAAAVLDGVYALRNLIDAQEKGLTIFWAHDLNTMFEWMHGTKGD